MCGVLRRCRARNPSTLVPSDTSSGCQSRRCCLLSRRMKRVVRFWRDWRCSVPTSPHRHVLTLRQRRGRLSLRVLLPRNLSPCNESRHLRRVRARVRIFPRCLPWRKSARQPVSQSATPRYRRFHRHRGLRCPRRAEAARASSACATPLNRQSAWRRR